MKTAQVRSFILHFTLLQQVLGHVKGLHDFQNNCTLYKLGSFFILSDEWKT